MKVTINDLARPAGTVLEIPYLGAFRNGETTEVTDQQLQFYKDNTGIELQEDIFIGTPDADLIDPVVEGDTDAPEGEDD